MSGPDEVTSLAKGSVLELRVGVNHEVVVSDCSEVASGGSEAYILHKSLASPHLFDVLWLDNLAVF